MLHEESFHSFRQTLEVFVVVVVVVVVLVTGVCSLWKLELPKVFVS